MLLIRRKFILDFSQVKEYVIERRINRSKNFYCTSSIFFCKPKRH